MPHRAPLRAVRQLLLDIQTASQASIATHGDIEAGPIADLIEEALADEVNRRGVLLGLAEYIATALDGGAIDPAMWTPLVRITAPQKKSCG